MFPVNIDRRVGEISRVAELFVDLGNFCDSMAVNCEYVKECPEKRRAIALQRHFYAHAFSHKGLRAPKAPLSRVACDRKPAILHG
jgi:hypothetical protein